MTIDDLILCVLLSWLVPLVLHEFYALTQPVPDKPWRRKWGKVSKLTPITRMLLAQKLGLILVVLFIAAVRFFGSFPGRDWIALGLYSGLVGLAWVIFAYMRILQLPGEREIRKQ